MRRCDKPRALPAAVLDDRHRKRRALGRVGARAELVKEHKGPVVELLEHADDVDHVRGEGGERLGNALFVTDIGENTGEEGNSRILGGGNMQAALRHQRK